MISRSSAALSQHVQRDLIDMDHSSRTSSKTVAVGFGLALDHCGVFKTSIFADPNASRGVSGPSKFQQVDKSTNRLFDPIRFNARRFFHKAITHNDET